MRTARTRMNILLLMALALGGLTASAQEPPHIIVILVDDMGFSDIGAFGGEIIPTPSLDRLASEGPNFTDYYSASPFCSPSRTRYLTGLFHAEWRLTTPLNDSPNTGSAEQAN